MNDHEYRNRCTAAPNATLFLCALLTAAASQAYYNASDLRDKLTDLTIRVRTDHYALAGTVSAGRLNEYGRALEYIYREYAKGFAELIVGRPAAGRMSDEQFKVIVFATDREYEGFAGTYLGGSHEHTRGLFIGSLQLVVIRDDPTMQETFEILFHEAFHQFMHRFVPAAPTWLNEGLATYYGTARPTASGLAFDRPRSEFFAVVRDAVDAKKLIPFDELMQAGPEDFYSRKPMDGLDFGRSTLQYGQSYTLIAYILTDGAGREHLRGYIRALARVRSPADARRVTRKHFSDPLLDKLVPGWLAFVNRN